MKRPVRWIVFRVFSIFLILVPLSSGADTMEAIVSACGQEADGSGVMGAERKAYVEVCIDDMGGVGQYDPAAGAGDEAAVPAEILEEKGDE